MRIRASVLTPILAMLTVVALVVTGIVLGQARGGDASATLLDSTPSSVAAAVPDTAAVADAGLPDTGGASLEQPIDQSVQVVQSAAAGPVLVAAGQRPPTTKPTTKPPTTPPTTDAPAPPVIAAGDDGSGSDVPDGSPEYEAPSSDLGGIEGD